MTIRSYEPSLCEEPVTRSFSSHKKSS
uniref:Uncharacterized protein n=1 Tax=Amphimedon queenslandica TaxID=400682 RepID=A0A1X7V0I7_AMPQE